MSVVALPAVRIAAVLAALGARFAGLLTMLIPIAGVSDLGIVTVAEPELQLPPVWAFVTANFFVVATDVMTIATPL
ncbi:unannotated protein [freshwater metagenome]|uniref:Unannotated protein n=1 Tax=freshwater metagenome TaxID=449393 RepID=A0A6J6PJK7_9ZZZZ